MFGIGFQEMLIILVVVLIFFGPKRLPDLAKSLGKGIAEFKKASEEVRKGIDDAVREESESGAPKPPEDLSAYGKAPGGATGPEAPATPGSGTPGAATSPAGDAPPDSPAPASAPPATAPAEAEHAAPGPESGKSPSPPPPQG